MASNTYEEYFLEQMDLISTNSNKIHTFGESKLNFMDIQHFKPQLKWKYYNYSSIFLNNKIFLKRGFATFSNGPWATFQNNYHHFLPSKKFASKYNKLYSSTINLTFINDKYIPSTFKYPSIPWKTIYPCLGILWHMAMVHEILMKQKPPQNIMAKNSHLSNVLNIW